MPGPDVADSIAAVWRIEAARLHAGLVRFTRDVALAEDCAQEALVAALQQWPMEGMPESPGAWLMACAKNKAVERFRHERMRGAKFAAPIDAPPPPAWDEALDVPVKDDLVRLIFLSCHPVLSPDARVALTLRLLGGLSTAEIARAFLIPEATVAQRIVRAKRTLGEAQLPFELPQGEALRERLASVLEVIYLIFNEGYAATSGTRWQRQELCEDALRLGRVVVGLLPSEPEVHGLLALMELTAARAPARIDERGAPVLLLAQNRARWDRLAIARGTAALKRAQALQPRLGPYALQAAIAGCHATALRAEDTDWTKIAALYAAMLQQAPSPVVALNHAVALGMAFGPAAGLEVIDALVEDGALAGYPYLWSARGDLLEKLDRREDAATDFERAAGLTQNEAERALLHERAAACRRG